MRDRCARRCLRTVANNAEPRAETWWDCPRGWCKRLHRTEPVPLALTTYSEHRKTHARARRMDAARSLPLSKAGALDHVSERRVERRRADGCTSRVLTNEQGAAADHGAAAEHGAAAADVGAAAANRGAAADGTERLIPQASLWGRRSRARTPARTPRRVRFRMCATQQACRQATLATAGAAITGASSLEGAARRGACGAAVGGASIQGVAWQAIL